MRILICLIIAIFTMVGCSNAELKNQNLEEMVKKNVTWTGSSSIIIKDNGRVIAIDPHGIKDKSLKADYILITHFHGDHMSHDDIKSLIKKETVIVSTKGVIETIKEYYKGETVIVEAGKSYEIAGLKLDVVYGYNTNPERTKYHSKDGNYLGFIVEANGVKMYHTGDTQRIPEMKDLDCDIMFVPVGQTYTMESVEEAVDAVLDTKAKLAIPMHYGLYEGKLEDAIKFKELMDKKRKAIILEKN